MWKSPATLSFPRPISPLGIINEITPPRARLPKEAKRENNTFFSLLNAGIEKVSLLPLACAFCAWVWRADLEKAGFARKMPSNLHSNGRSPSPLS